VKCRFLFVVVLGLALGLTAAPAWGNDFYVIAGGGPSGKVLKTQVFTSTSYNGTLGSSVWAKLSHPQWTYTKLSATSYLVITYQDGLYCTGTGGWGAYQVRVNDQPSVAGVSGAMLVSFNALIHSGATGVWTNLPKGDVNLSIYHMQQGCTECLQNPGMFKTNVTVMEIEH
jgi:hypothetical protein